MKKLLHHRSTPQRHIVVYGRVFLSFFLFSSSSFFFFFGCCCCGVKLNTSCKGTERKVLKNRLLRQHKKVLNRLQIGGALSPLVELFNCSGHFVSTVVEYWWERWQKSNKEAHWQNPRNNHSVFLSCVLGTSTSFTTPWWNEQKLTGVHSRSAVTVFVRFYGGML